MPVEDFYLIMDAVTEFRIAQLQSVVSQEVTGS